MPSDPGPQAVELIQACLDTPPEEHQMECLEERWLAEVGESPAFYISQAIVYGSQWADLLAWWSWAHRRGELVVP